MSISGRKSSISSSSAFFKAAEPPKTIPVIKFFAQKFNVIRPDDDTERGNCMSCAAEAAKVFLSKPEYKPTPINDGNASGDEDETFEPALSKKKFRTSKKDASADFFNYLNSDEQKPGSVFLANTEDHTCVIFKSFEKDLYLIDCDAHIYKQFENLEDLTVPHRMMIPESISPEQFKAIEARTKQKGFFNYFYDNEESKITLYLMGQADPVWKNVSELIAAEKKSDEPAKITRPENN